MRYEWEDVAILDIGTVKGGATPLTKVKEYYGGNIPWITPKDLSGYSSKYIFEGERSITKAGFDSTSVHLLPKGTVLFSSRAPIGYIAIAGNNLTTNQGFKSIIPNSEKVLSNFLYYLLHFNKDKIENLGSGTTFKEVSGRVLENFRVRIPSLNMQKRIYKILNSLDEKIELNNKINENLEQQAQTIFKSWFVDFEPFQDGKFVESELGMIPKGWKIEKLGELIDVKYGKDHRALSDGDIPVYGSGGIMRYVDKSLYEKETVLIPRKGSLNNVTLINHPFWSVDTMFYTQMKIENFTKFLYHLLLMKDLASMNVGSAVPSMTVSLLNEIKFALPPMSILAEFENITSAIYNLIWSNQKENLILSNIRDTLLPKLMSGEIEVPIE